MRVTLLGHAAILVEMGQAASPFCRTLEDDTHQIGFNPTDAIPPLHDSNPDGYDSAEMKRNISRVIEQDLFEYCMRNARDQLKVAGRYFECKAIYVLEVIFLDFKIEWTIDFSTDPVRLYRTRNPQANVVHRIAGSALYGWILRRKSLFYFRAYSRRFTISHRVYRDDAEAGVIPVQLPDLLMHYLIYGAEDTSDSALRRMDYEITQLKRTYSS